MNKIPSFTINHLRLLPGVYVSRRDTLPGGSEVTTFDIRLTAPNREAALSPQTLHAMEHLAATFLRNHPTWGPEIIYWGPMGCCTGSYLLLKGHREPQEILPLLREAFSFMADFQGEIPGASPRDCGNYSFMDPQGCRKASARFLRLLESPDLPTEYPQ